MSVNRFGQSRLKVKDSSVVELRNKLNKSGDRMTGDLDMNNYTIVNVKTPINNSDCSSKLYCDNNFYKLYDEMAEGVSYNVALIRQDMQSKLNTNGGTMTGKLDMNNNAVTNVKQPENADDVATKSYCDEKITDEIEKWNIDKHQVLRDNINIEKLLKVSNIIAQNLSEPYFNFKRKCVLGLYTAIVSLYKDDTRGKRILEEFEGLPFVKDLKTVIMRVILDLSEGDFVIFRGILLDNGLLNNLETIQFKTRSIVNELANKLNPERKNRDIELLTQKNEILIELGYIFIHEGLFG